VTAAPVVAVIAAFAAFAAFLGPVPGVPSTAQAGPRRWRGRPPVEVRLAPPPGTGRLRNAAQGLCLDVAGWAGRGKGNVLLWECNDDPDHVWEFASDGQLHNTLTGTCLDAAGYDGAAGSGIDVFRCEGMDDQRWTLVPRGRGAFEIHNLKRGLCLDIDGRAGGRGDNALLWTCDGGADQIWSWEPYVAPLPGPRLVRGPRRPGEPPFDPSDAPPPPPPPPPAPAPPPAPSGRREARPRPMEDPAFRALMAAVRNEGFSESQLAVIRQASARNYFSVGQLKEVIDVLPFSATKLGALDIGAPRIVDPENAFAVYDAFTFSGDKEQAREILRRHGL